MKYENRIVLFLDILGFQGIIDKTIVKGEDQTFKIKKLYDALIVIKDEVSFIKEGSSKVVTQFSDSIVVSFEENDTKEVTLFFRSILSLIIKLVSHDIICRGAISYGKLYHSEDFVFGPALNDAYLTESTAALYPRVILDKSIVDALKANHKRMNQDILSHHRMISKTNSILNSDTDDKQYFDYFTGALSQLHDESVVQYFKDLRLLISKGLRYEKPSVKIKYGWMKNKFNSFIDELPQLMNEYNLSSDYLVRLSKTDKL